ncbi:MAG TPA: toxin TcdB middle/N-terminal domain-containing protein [Polyangiaceae bacterium]|nr:toxin TcdB middle/N-terminal domain-containing protein [Polyangiaceae bacterium]
MSLKRSDLGLRAVSAVTLFCFSVTTLSPSLAWAVTDTERPSAPVYAGGDVSAKDVEPAAQVAAEKTEEAAEAGKAANDAAVRRDRADVHPSKDLEKETAGLAVSKQANGDAAAVSASSDAETLALPTGGDKSGVTSQAISVPKGAGTVQGMGESFSAQLSTGIATFSVPFSLPAARGGAQPSLGISYSSASGAGLAGMGWSVGVPYIARQTDRGLPGYDDQADWHPNQDRFVFNGGQELVPICTVGSVAPDAPPCDSIGEKMPTWATGAQYFRPRVEGSFLRFFWLPNHRTWRVEDKSGVTLELGAPLDGAEANALDVNPNDSNQIFRWHLVRQYDAYCSGGANCNASATPQPLNLVVYRYFQNSGQAYLSDIFDTTPGASPTTSDLGAFAHHTHLNYEDRPDPTETYNSGWLIRQTKRLIAVDVASKTFEGAGSARRQVRRYHLGYDSRFHTSYLTSVQVEGRCGDGEKDSESSVPIPIESQGLLDGACSGTQEGCQQPMITCGTLPAMTFDYSHTKGYNTSGTAIASRLDGYEAFDQRIKQIGGDPPHSIDEELSDFFDVDADGLPDLLVTAPGVYGNDFGYFLNATGGIANTFSDAKQMPVRGVLGANSGAIKLSNANVMPLDIDADGIVDFVHMPKVKSYAVYHFQGGGLVGEVIDAANRQSPKIDLGKDAAETKIADVNFDGLVDLVVSTGTEFQTFYSLGRFPNGYGQFGKATWSASDAASISNDPIRRCVPYSGTPVRFSDGDIQLADMNGDGIQDIVRLRRGDIRYWPGRGNGFWGTGKLDDCPAGSFGDKRYLTMDSAPFYSDIQGTSLRMDDVNGDGLDDLVQVRFDAVDVWLNVDGHGWTQRYIIDGTVASPSFANRVRLMDLNGSGTRDVVWGNGRKYEYMDLAGGERPGLLIQVKNGLGKSTDIEYSTSTDEMLAAERTGIACAGDASAFESAWCSKMPTVTHVVSRVTESDNLAIAGFRASSYVTEYSYRDPVYEGRQREFRGFRRARSKRVGDANSPSDFTESTFLLGECEDETPDDDIEDCSIPERWRDNPKEALKGLPVVTERYDEAGKRLSTALTTYRLRHLYTGLDGRRVRHAFQSASKTYQYDTAAAGATQATQTFNAVELELTRQADFHPEDRPPTVPTGVTTDARLKKLVSFAPYATAGVAVVEGSSIVDWYGNAQAAIDNGCTGGAACETADETIYKYTLPKLIGDWIFRTERSYATGSTHTKIRGESKVTYDDHGAPTRTEANLTDTVALYRAHDTAGRTFAANPPTTASAEGWRVLSVKAYDDFGNVTQDKVPTNDPDNADDVLRCRDITYDSDTGFAQLPVAETTYVGGCSSADPLLVTASYDRALGLVTSVTDFNSKTSTVKYDEFGRLVELTRPRGTTPPPNQQAPADPPLQTILIDYTLASPENGRYYSTIHTKSQDGVDELANSYVHSYSFVDGMGRARVGITQADTTAGDLKPWIVSSVADFDAKGAVRRKYLPFFLDGDDPAVFPLTGPPNTQYGEQRYDSFGRQLQTFDVDGTVTLQSRYHALSTDLYDAADIYPGPHQGSYATTRTDGHGRTVETTERVHVSGSLEKRYVRTQYLATGEPEVITRQREADAANAVTRWMRYDSLGRMVLNVDPHTSVNFTTDVNVNADPVSGTLKAWRYVYDDAGDLVATSDARGCGQNFYYDGAGRLFGEDFSPCIKAHPLYTAPAVNTATRSNPRALTSTNGFEVFYQYDSSSSLSGAAPTDYSTANLKGRLSAVHDRASTTWFSYDERGRGIATYRRVTAYNQGGNAIISTRYSPRWYKKTTSYDAADRPVTESTGATQVLGGDGKSEVTTHYTKRGTVASVDSSYGGLVDHVTHDAQGLVGEIEFGDAANTTTVMKYDSRRRLSSVQTIRAGSAWTSPPASYLPAPQPDADPPTSFQLVLQDLDYSYDIVGNPTEIRDWRTPDEWPAGAKPVSRRMEYDDLYRVTRVDYEYPGGWDKHVSAFAPEQNGQTDARQPVARGQKQLSKRPLWQTYAFDWLGNTTKTDDDQHVFMERSLGTITPNTPANGTKRPYQMLSAAQSVSGSTQNGSTPNIAYDDAGNVTSFAVNASATGCLMPTGCSPRYFYTWDELGRLLQARRVEGEGPNATGVWVNYTYDANDERVRKTADYSGVSTPGQYFDTLYVFDSLEIRRTAWDSAAGEYPLSTDNEVPYLSAHGMRLARVAYEPAARGEPRSPSTDPVHVFLELPDHLGSASIVLDRATSELVEARTYQPYGATESDYRPDRWKGFREDYGFTGKEEDAEVGLQYFGKRYLSPYLGRWISPDPLAVHAPGEADLNLYVYVSGEVLKAIDPLGLEKIVRGLTAERVTALSTQYGEGGSAPRSGALFERTVLRDMFKRWLVRPNVEKFDAPGRASQTQGQTRPQSKVKPDGIHETTICKQTCEMFDKTAFIDIQEDFVEIKKSGSTLSPSYNRGQLEGMLEALEAKAKQIVTPIASNWHPTLWLVTTADTTISPTLIASAREHGVRLFHSVVDEVYDTESKQSKLRVRAPTDLTGPMVTDGKGKQLETYNPTGVAATGMLMSPTAWDTKNKDAKVDAPK